MKIASGQALALLMLIAMKPNAALNVMLGFDIKNLNILLPEEKEQFRELYQGRSGSTPPPLMTELEKS